jgi:hypothetical protein
MFWPEGTVMVKFGVCIAPVCTSFPVDDDSSARCEDVPGEYTDKNMPITNPITTKTIKLTRISALIFITTC